MCLIKILKHKVYTMCPIETHFNLTNCKIHFTKIIYQIHSQSVNPSMYTPSPHQSQIQIHTTLVLAQTKSDWSYLC